MFTLILIYCSVIGQSKDCLDGFGFVEEHIPSLRICNETADAYHYGHSEDQVRTWCVQEEKK